MRPVRVHCYTHSPHLQVSTLSIVPLLPTMVAAPTYRPARSIRSVLNPGVFGSPDTSLAGKKAIGLLHGWLFEYL